MFNNLEKSIKRFGFQMRQLTEDDQSVGTALSLGQSFQKEGAEDGSKCNLFEEQENKSLRRQSALYHVSLIFLKRLFRTCCIISVH